MRYYIGLVPFSSDYLEHHGVKGQKHGVRQYQNPDGSLTPEGREHYGVGDPRKAGSKSDNPAGRSKSATKRSTSSKVSSTKGKPKEKTKESAKEKKKPGRIKNWSSNYDEAAKADAKIFGKTLGMTVLSIAAGVATQNPTVTKVGFAAAATYGAISADIVDTKYEANKYSILTDNKKVFEYEKKKK